MKVLRIIARLNVGGPARHVLLVDGGLRKRGHDTLLVYGQCGPGEASMETLLRDSGNPAMPLSTLRRRVRLIGDIVALWGLLRIIWRTRPDVVHTHTAKAGALGRLAATVSNLTRPRSRRAAIVHTFHGHVLEGYFSRPIAWFVRRTERLLAHLTDLIVVLSPQQQREITDRFHVAPASSVRVVPLGLDLGSLLALDGPRGELRSRLGIGADEFVVGYIGRLVPIKNLALLIDAVGDLSTHAPVRLIIAGDGPEREPIRQKLAARGMERCTTMLGWYSELEEFYRAIDVIALSSHNEGTPVALIEAMAAGRPVVATAVGGVPDIVQDGVTGLLVAPGDRPQFAAALAALASDADRRNLIGRKGREYARSTHSVDRLVTDLEHLYDDALKRARGDRSPVVHR